MRIGINGFGRIGRCIMRAHSDLPLNIAQSIPIVAINSSTNKAEDITHLLKYDSIHGVWNQKINYSDNCFEYGSGNKVNLLNCSNPADIPWKDFEVDLVLECSGNFNSKEQAAKHLSRDGASWVLVSAPCKNVENTIILGVNDLTLQKVALSNKNITDFSPESRVLSAGSCTTNCLAPIAKALNDNLGIVNGFLTTIHAYTNDQQLLDSRHKDKRRSRAAAMSMIPTSTGAAKSIGEVIPELAGKIDGIAIRVPIPNVSIIDLTFQSLRDTTEEEINDIINAASKKYPNIIKINNEELVSVDFNHSSYSAIFDATQTRVVNKSFCRVAAWYDNEWGFANRMLDIAINLSNYLKY